MKKVIRYMCEICKQEYSDSDEAVTCEEKGIEKPLAKVGDIVNHRVEMSGGFNDWFIGQRISDIEQEGHRLNYYFEEYNQETGGWEVDYNFFSVWGNSKFKSLITLKDSK
jgi:hypothetical protein